MSYSSSIDLSSLNGTNGFRLDGAVLGDRSGVSVASAGDVNGDGFADLIIGAPLANNLAGGSYVIFGKAGGFASSLDLGSLDGTAGFQLIGAGAETFSGLSVASAGDVDGDGFADLIIGAPYEGGYAGASFVVFGKASGFASSINLGDLNGTTGFRLDGTGSNALSGVSVASAGDVNGDGFADLLIGAMGGNAGTGASYVVFGQSSGFASSLALSDLDGTTGFRLNGATVNDVSGGSVASAGDVNGDGFADLIIGSPAANTSAGVSHVVFGKASGFASSIDLANLNGTAGFRLDGEAAIDQSCTSVASAGDVNGDGFADIIIGAERAFGDHGASYVIFGKSGGFASALALSSLDGTNGFRLNGSAVSDAFGRSVASAGDVNGDGYADLIIGAFGADPNGNSNAGSTYVVFGQSSGFASSLDLSDLNLTGVTGGRLNGVAADDESGGSVASAGDVNGDGLPDIIIGASYAAANGSGTGSSYVYLSHATSGATYRGTTMADRLHGTAFGDIIYGNGGNDTITSGAGTDRIYAGTGDDTVIWAPGDGYDIIDLGSGTNIIDFGNNAQWFRDVGADRVFDIGGNSVRVVDWFTGNNSVADHTPSVTSGGSATVTENATGTVYTATGSDPDAGTTLSWSLGGPDSDLFDINATTGAVTFKTAPNYEAPADYAADNIYDITVTASDGVFSSAEKSVTITVTNGNEAPIITSAATASFAENATGTVYTATGIDPDAGTTLSWSLGGPDSDLFDINATTGAVTFKAAPNFEDPADYAADNIYDITVTASDGGSSPVTKSVTITVTNINEAPFITSAATSTVTENATGTVYDATGSDPDTGTTLSWSLGGTDAALFNINATTGAVTFKTAPNYEAPADDGKNNVYDITVTAFDGALSSAAKAVTITVTDANEAPIITSAATASFTENATGTVYTATGSDPDTGTILSWSLGGTDAALFNINATTGTVTFKAAPDYEAPADAGKNNVYDITVTAFDGVLSSAAKAVAITVLNIDEAILGASGSDRPSPPSSPAHPKTPTAPSPSSPISGPPWSAAHSASPPTSNSATSMAASSKPPRACAWRPKKSPPSPRPPPKTGTMSNPPSSAPCWRTPSPPNAAPNGAPISPPAPLSSAWSCPPSWNPCARNGTQPAPAPSPRTPPANAPPRATPCTPSSANSPKPWCSTPPAAPAISYMSPKNSCSGWRPRCWTSWPTSPPARVIGWTSP